MAKKVQKGKAVKKSAKPAKKAVAKKSVKPAKKNTPKKVSKPVKKVAAKKPAPKKVVAKKVVKKAVPQKVVAKKNTPKKVSKPLNKVIAKKPAPKKVVKKVVAKKVVKPAKKIVVAKVKPQVKKAEVKAIAKKPVVTAKVEIKKTVAVVAKTPVKTVLKPVAKKRDESSIDMDEDDNRMERTPMPVYEPRPVRRPDPNQPKPHINKDTRTRYSEKELQEFKALILSKLTEAKKDYEILKSTLTHRDDNGTDDTSPSFKLLEDGSDVLSKEETSQLAGRQEKFIQNLQNALIRIENKTYGICRVTGKLISKERLRSVPHATLAIEAKLEQA